MSQHDYSIANASGSAVRADLNNALGAIATSNSGATEPSTTYAYQVWADTTTNKLKIRNGANNAWFEVGTLDTANLGLMLASFFPNVNSNITASDEELNKLDGAAVTTAEINLLSGLSSTAAELNVLDGITSNTTELNLLDGITAIKDEDTMSSNSATSLATQQSIKAYVDTEIAGISQFDWTVTEVNTTFSNSYTYTVPANAIGLYVNYYHYMGSNQGSRALATIKDAGLNVLHDIWLSGGNEGNGTDGGSGMSTRASSFIPLPSNASTVVFTRDSGSGTASGKIEAVVKKA